MFILFLIEQDISYPNHILYIRTLEYHSKVRDILGIVAMFLIVVPNRLVCDHQTVREHVINSYCRRHNSFEDSILNRWVGALYNRMVKREH